MMDVAPQSNGSDCGVLAIAHVFDICSGLNPCEVQFDFSMIRKHLVTCLELGCFSRFPLLGERRSDGIKYQQNVDLHCSCRMPEKEGDQMAACDLCHIWYHRHCLDIPSVVFTDSDIDWICMDCHNSVK